MVESLFFEISVVLALAAALAALAMVFKQNAIWAYILTGVIMGPLGYLAFNSKGTLEVMSKIGITLLLFLVGLEMNPSSVKHIGKSAVIIGVGQIIFTAVIGYFISLFLGFSFSASIFIALALTFSSTIIVIKILSEKKDLDSLYGKLVVGILLTQDFIALAVLLFLAGYNTGDASVFSILIAFIKGAVLFFILIIFGKKILPKYMDFVARSPEILFLTSIAFAMGVASIFTSHYIGLSLEVGGFLAGIALSYSSERYQIHSRIRPLRDFFIVIFFIILGSTLALKESVDILLPVIVFSTFVLIGNPLIVMITMGFLGYKKRTSFMSGIAIAQVSEFSFILMQVGMQLGQVNDRAFAIIMLTGIITITISSYLIIASGRIYKLISPFLKIFERKIMIEKSFEKIEIVKHTVLIGAHRLGKHLLSVLQKDGTIVIDFNPDRVKKIEAEGYKVIYGDISDEEIQDDANILKAKLIISTVPDLEDGLVILERIKNENIANPPKVILTAMNEWEAKMLYKKGADYVILPHFIGAQQIAHMIMKDHDLPRIREFRERDLAILG